MMPYTIKWRNKALDQLRKLPKEVAKRIVIKVNLSRNNPPRFFEKLVGDSGYKLRAGDYRIIVDIIGNEQLIAVRIVDHRKRIYKKHSLK